MSDTGHPKPVLSDNWSDGVGREVGGGFRRERTYVPMADSRSCVAKPITVLQSNYPPIIC